MAIYFNALIVCDRCDAELRMDDVDTESEVERRLRNSDSKWADDEDGKNVCGDCWEKWERKHGDVATDTTSLLVRSTQVTPKEESR